MDNTREKFIELFLQAIEKCGGWVTPPELADYLIANGVTVPKHGRWIIRSSGRGSQTTNWAECSECHVCGSPQWKVCPVCETKMDSPNITENTMNALKRMGEKVHRED